MTLTKKDLLTKLKPLITNRGFKIRPDGKFTTSPSEPSIQWNSPWVHQYQDGSKDCYKWHNVFFNTYGLTPTACKNCWKVVVMPRTLVELFDLYELQKELDHPCKCGIELRETDERNYGGYFYNNSFESGKKCWEMVREAVSDKISPDINVTLKCACTEFEIKNGPVQEYEPTESQLELEYFMEEYTTFNDTKFIQPDYLVAHIMLSWIHRAVKIGDMTYKTFTDGNPLVKKLKTYHDEEKENG